MECNKLLSLPPASGSMEAGLSALSHASQSSWWDWDAGSSPFFWSFPPDWLIEMRDGLPPMWVDKRPAYTRKQQNLADADTCTKDKGQVCISSKTGLHRAPGEYPLPDKLFLGSKRGYGY
ncbi:hypothetical protein ACA910_019804 [Epithemia clementina (nom. ined.)]